ncbi:MAG: hypothetical protein ACREHE_12155 [Rhizomicrobium sp.]
MVKALCATAALLIAASAVHADPAATPAPPTASAPTPAQPDPLAGLAPLDPANARVVIVRESSAAAALANAKIYVNGEKAGAAGNGEVFVFDHAPGQVVLEFDNPLTFFGGNLELPTVLVAGQTVYVHLTGMIGRMGVLGAVVQSEASQNEICSSDWCGKVVPANYAAYLMSGLPVRQAAK